MNVRYSSANGDISLAEVQRPQPDLQTNLPKKNHVRTNSSVRDHNATEF